MNDAAWFLLIALSALALASMSVRSVLSHRGQALAVYVVTLVLAAGAGVGIAVAVDGSYAVLGGVIGVAAVEVGPTFAKVAGATIRRVAGKVGKDKSE
jgi:hypothetical protein